VLCEEGCSFVLICYHTIAYRNCFKSLMRQNTIDTMSLFTHNIRPEARMLQDLEKIKKEAADTAEHRKDNPGDDDEGRRATRGLGETYGGDEGDEQGGGEEVGYAGTSKEFNFEVGKNAYKVK
jgi:hypothetical protein